MPKKALGTYDVDGISMLNAKVDSLVKMFGNMGHLNYISNFTLNCSFCGGAHMNTDCTNVEQTQYMTNFNRQQPQQSNPYSNTYNAGWRNHPNFSQKDQGNSARSPHPPGFQQRQFQQESKQPWELANEKLAKETSKLANETSERFERIEASQRNMEIQLGQLASAINP